MKRTMEYLTIDPVNAAEAQTLAAALGLRLEVVEPRDLPWLERAGADLIVDWDALPDDYRDRLLNGSAVNLVGVHGYDLGESLLSFLPRRGVLCASRLDGPFFKALTDDAASDAA